MIRAARRIKHFAASRVLKGIGDDCAVIRTPGAGALLITSDVFIDGVHFLSDRQQPESVGAKLLAVNLSDIAAMGGRPGEVVVDLMLPKETPIEWVEAFFDGMSEVAQRYAVNVVGGDTSRHPDRITLALTLTGYCRRDEVIYRKGAKPGDGVYVSGTLGDSDGGLEQIRNGAEWSKRLDDCYCRPEPRIELGRLLARTRCSNAMIDLSDGLAIGSRQLAEASGVQIALDPSLIPLSAELDEWCRYNQKEPIEWALRAAGDYELLFTVPADRTRQVERFGKHRPDLVQITRIGEVRSPDGGGVAVVLVGGAELMPSDSGWEHFR